MTLKQVRDRLTVDTVSVKDGVFTVRRSFFYTHGYTAAKFVEYVKHVLPQAVVVDQGEVWKPFNGGQSVARGSHWYVKFTVKES